MFTDESPLTAKCDSTDFVIVDGEFAKFCDIVTTGKAAKKIIELMSTSSILFDSVMIPYVGFIVPENMNLNASAYVYSPCRITNISIKNDDTVEITAQLNEGVEDQIKNKSCVLSVDKRNTWSGFTEYSVYLNPIK